MTARVTAEAPTHANSSLLPVLLNPVAKVTDLDFRLFFPLVIHSLAPKEEKKKYNSRDIPSLSLISILTSSISGQISPKI